MLVVYNTVTNLRPGGDHGYISRNVVAGALLIVLARRRGLTWRDLGLASADLGSGWRWGRLGAAVCSSTVALSPVLARRWGLGRQILGDRRAALPPRQVAWQALVRIPIGTAAFEEIAFRGVLFALLHHAAGGRVALVGSSAAFGLWHVGPTLAALRVNDVEGEHACPTAAAVASTAVLGVALAGLRLRSGHVLACWLAHWMSNAVGLAVAARWQSNHAVSLTPASSLGADSVPSAVV
jgi:membrane protease YdiL (CAAX protease family)